MIRFSGTRTIVSTQIFSSWQLQVPSPLRPEALQHCGGYYWHIFHSIPKVETGCNRTLLFVVERGDTSHNKEATVEFRGRSTTSPPHIYAAAKMHHFPHEGITRCLFWLNTNLFFCVIHLQTPKIFLLFPSFPCLPFVSAR